MILTLKAEGQTYSFYLLPIEKASGIYCVLTSVLMLLMLPYLVDLSEMLAVRCGWLAMTALLVFVGYLLSRHESLWSKSYVRDAMETLRTVAQLAWLILWYPDTYQFNRVLPNLDHFFAHADQALFGCQPAIEFSQALPQPFWSEAFSLGYWSYYPMMVILVFAVLWKQRPAFQLVASDLITSFFIFYVIFIIIPVAGPQFYFQAVGIPDILAGHFPPLGTYFSSHTQALPVPGYTDGTFYQLVCAAQEAGERPTAAFPSSHVGISTIVLLLARRHTPRLLILFLPLWILLCCATVYIRAHYLVDALAGLIVAPLILWAAEKCVGKLMRG